MSESNLEGIVLLGAGGDPNQWINGVLGMWKEGGLSPSAEPSDVLESALLLISTGGRHDLALIFKNGVIDVSGLAMWRIGFGNCSWVSDFVVNYSSHY